MPLAFWPPLQVVPKNFKTIKASVLDRNRQGTEFWRPCGLTGAKNKRGTVFPALATASKLILALSAERTREHIRTTSREQNENQEQTFIGTGHPNKIVGTARNGTENKPREPINTDSQTGSTPGHERPRYSLFSPWTEQGENKSIPFRPKAGTKNRCGSCPQNTFRAKPGTNRNCTPAGSHAPELVPAGNYHLRSIYTTGCGALQKFWLTFAPFRRLRTKQ